MILDVMRRAIDVSQHLSFLKSDDIVCPGEMIIAEQSPLTYANAIYLATLGGAEGKMKNCQYELAKFTSCMLNCSNQ